MKKFNKTLLAGALVVAAGSANAALVQGEAYLVAFDANYVAVAADPIAGTAAVMGRTFNLDLGTTFAALQANTSAALSSYIGASNNLAADANWLAFTTLGAGESALSITYGIYAAGNTAAQATNGVFVSGAQPQAPLATAGTTPAGSTTTWGTSITQIDRQGSEITGPSSIVVSTAAGALGSANGVPSFNTLWGGSTTDPTAAYGSTNNLYYGATHLGTVVARGKTTTGVALLAQSDITNVGSFTLAGNTLSFTAAGVSAVPLPAAVWMFGAGLMGMLRVNRRTSVQA